MSTYTEKDILKIAKRYGNVKRSYLLVNPLQAKHVPTSPSSTLKMMDTLGERVQQLFPKTKVVIGFAETATAIGAVIATHFESCLYVQTTREQFPENDKCLCFNEEHSHAVEQKLCSTALNDAFACTETVLLVDDEISTGKTLINIVEQIKKAFPCVKEKCFVAVSLINRVSLENTQLLLQNGIACECLLKIANESYDEQIAKYEISAPQEIAVTNKIAFEEFSLPYAVNPRVGVTVTDFMKANAQFVEDACQRVLPIFAHCQSVLLLGTEESMYPAIKVGEALERRLPNCKIRVHATTRSPIGVCNAEDYPIKNGYHIHSFYEKERQTFIYNANTYDAVAVCTDSWVKTDEAMQDICQVFSAYGCEKFFLIRGNVDV